MATVRRTHFKLALWFGVLLCVMTVIVLLAMRLRDASRPLGSAQLPDGRILQIEGLSYGTEHHIGTRSLFENFAPWLPKTLNELVAPRFPRSEIHLDTPSLGVWVNAIDPLTGKQVDCQGIRVEFIDEHGDLFGEETSSWFGR